MAQLATAVSAITSVAKQILAYLLLLLCLATQNVAATAVATLFLLLLPTTTAQLSAAGPPYLIFLFSFTIPSLSNWQYADTVIDSVAMLHGKFENPKCEKMQIQV